jgi:hypothetical protein|tara:strand:- start:121 stop:444 length:324 start_codon:yes stop_codon:yes gene_type:complete
MANEENTKANETVEAPETATAGSTASAGQQAPQPDPTALSIGDLKNLMTILDVASTRGAFKASEMSGVGYIYNKLQAFLAKVAPEQRPEGIAGATAPVTAPATAEGK